MVASVTAPSAPAYLRRIDDVLAALGTDAQRGLTDEDARAGLVQYGPNALPTEKPVPAWRRFLAQFQDAVVILLLVAAAISLAHWALERDTANMAAGTLYVFDASLPSGFVAGSGTLPYGQTMAFTTLMLFQMFNVANARSGERSAFVRLFTNGWLWVALAGSLVLQVLVVHVPFLQRAFGTVALTGSDWLFGVGVASSVLWLREASKLATR
jgi:magnesium-transporting ATPase (P-type)